MVYHTHEHVFNIQSKQLVFRSMVTPLFFKLNMNLETKIIGLL